MKRSKFFLSALVLSALLSACSGGQKNIPVDAFGLKITDGEVTAYSFKNGVKGNLLDTKMVNGDKLVLKIPATRDPVLVELSGAVYYDFVAEEPVKFSLLDKWTAVFIPAHSEFNDENPLQINPFTTIGTALASYKIWYSSDQVRAIEDSNGTLEQHFKTELDRPFIKYSGDGEALMDDEGTKYYVLIGGLEQLAKDISSESATFDLNDLVANLYEDIATDGLADGLGKGGRILLGKYVFSKNTLSTDLASSIRNFIDAKGIELTPELLSLIQAINDSDSALFNIPGGPSDLSDPNIESITPKDGSYVSGTTTLRIKATDASGISEIHVFIKDSDGTQLNDTDPAPDTFESQIDTTKLYDGPFAINVRTIDKSSNATDTIYVFWADNTKPYVTSNLDSTRIIRDLFDIRVEAQDNSGIKSVVFKDDAEFSVDLMKTGDKSYFNLIDAKNLWPQDGYKDFLLETTDNAGNVTSQTFRLLINNFILTKSSRLSISNNLSLAESSAIEIKPIGDFNNDSYSDIMIGKTSPGGNPRVLLGDSKATFSSTRFTHIYASDFGQINIANNCNFNNDGYEDYLIGNPLGECTKPVFGIPVIVYGYALVQYGLLPFSPESIIPTPDNSETILFAHNVECADIDNDGISEVLVSDIYGRLFLYIGITRSFITLKNLDFGDLYRLKDINNDGYEEILIRTIDTDFIYYPKNNWAKTTFQNFLVADYLDKDDFSDILAYSTGPYRILIYKGQPILGKTPSASITTSAAFKAITSAAIGDVDGDGNKDILVGHPYASVGSYANAGKVVLYLGPDFKSTRTIQSPSPATGMNFGIAVDSGFDLNHDGLDEVIIRAPGADDDLDFYVFTDY